MPLSWNEIKDRALNFSKEWADTSNEEADAKPFLVEFFNVFGIRSKRVGTFEHRVKKLDDKDGYIDLLWKGTILIEMKSRGKNLDKAFQQALDYTHGLKQHELPKYILICDFETFKLFDLEEDKHIEFKLNDLVNNVQHFGYLLGYQKKVYKEQDPANIKAAELMGKLHDRLKEIGYTGHPLEVYLVRILFIMFAEDTTIFNKQQFQDFIVQRTNEDGSDLAAKLQEIFQVLNTPHENRFKNLDEQLAEFPYVNGKLFEEILPMASFDRKMRQALLECCSIDWSKISPAIFGSMFQSVMNPTERRNLGAHYTSEANILKLIKPLFLDELWREFESVKGIKNKLPEFHKKLSTLKFLDPACGCGNFLVITYRELRLLELEILRELHKTGQRVTDIGNIIWLNVDQFYGIEYEEFPARIAEVAMWLIDHQMNMIISNEFGQYFARLPLKRSAKIVNENALNIDWKEVVPEDNLSFIIGNPPFLGHHYQNTEQKEDMIRVFQGHKGCGVLDYVSAWYYKAAQYIQKTDIRVAFVSTNSISQGEQAGILWGILINKFNIKIHFAHRTFCWTNEAKGKAAVHVVIIGFANFDITNKTLFEYDSIKAEPHQVKASNINPYLVEAKDIIISTRIEPICNVPKMIWGNKPTDGGHFIFDDEKQLNDFLHKEPKALKWIRPYMSGENFIRGNQRYCLWLVDIDPSELNQLPETKKRVAAVKEFRMNSKASLTRKNAEKPTQFVQISQPTTSYLAIPEVSSERRKYIPISFINPNVIASNTIQLVPGATLWHFGILTSFMHNIWMRNICGRLKSDFRYSNSLVYNNYPWPLYPNEKQVRIVEDISQQILDIRGQFSNSSLADLYDPLTMPPALVKAHNELDKAVDLAYRPQPFTSEAKRMEFLFELYEKYTANLFTVSKRKKTKG
ncbi:MAG: N-6 DNA methylase [Tenuifilaceae bacterium]|jgi:type I restriction-modification system DNA methylase subunit|nr:N-6 DNA methylase [Tenuifilaceae bacterium]